MKMSTTARSKSFSVRATATEGAEEVEVRIAKFAPPCEGHRVRSRARFVYRVAKVVHIFRMVGVLKRLSSE